MNVSSLTEEHTDFSDHFSIIYPHGTETGSSCAFRKLMIWMLLHP